LLLAAGNATGLPVLYNTSFNLFGDPLVCNRATPFAAFIRPHRRPVRSNFLLNK